MSDFFTHTLWQFTKLLNIKTFLYGMSFAKGYGLKLEVMAMRFSVIRGVFASAALCCAGMAWSAPILPVSYEMANGDTGAYNYWDDSYSGSGNKTLDGHFGSYLSGGLGDLTDGVIATANWNVTESPAGPGPYVGWGWGADTSITFHFGPSITLQTLRIYYDDANGYGGVATPESIQLLADGHSVGEYFIVDAPGSAPNVFVVNFADLAVNDLTLNIRNRLGWIFLSEVEFDGIAPEPEPVPVPEPGALLLMGLAGILLTATRVRSNKK